MFVAFHYSATTESAATVSAVQESQHTVESSQVAVESTATVSAAGAAALLQDTNDTDAVRAIAATAAKTNFFIIF